MSGFDPETFAEEKYMDYFPQLQRAYKAAFDVMNERYDSSLVHAIDQQVLNESEPFYEPDEGSFRVELPEQPYERLDGVPVGRERFEAVLEEYCTQLEAALADELLD